MPSEAAKKPSMMNSKRPARDQSGEVKLPLPALSDNTQISGATWGELKEKAMQSKYFETSLFVKFLKPHEKTLLRQCIEAQKAQGNMHPLRLHRQSINMGRVSMSVM